MPLKPRERRTDPGYPTGRWRRIAASTLAATTLGLLGGCDLFRPAGEPMSPAHQTRDVPAVPGGAVDAGPTVRDAAPPVLPGTEVDTSTRLGGVAHSPALEPPADAGAAEAPAPPSLPVAR